MSRFGIKKKIFFFTVKFPLATVLVILSTFLTLLLIMYSTHTNIYLKQKAELLISKDNKDVFIDMYVNKKNMGQANINSNVLWYLQQEGQWYTAPIIDIKDVPGKNDLCYIRIKPVQEEVQKELSNISSSTRYVNVEILTGKERMINKLLLSSSEVAQ